MSAPRSRTLARLARSDDDGVAMILVIGVSAMIAALLVAGTAFAIGSVRAGQQSQDWNGALAAAFAGVEEYRSRLANDTSYVRNGNPAAQFGKPATGVADKRNLPTGAAHNPAFEVTAGGAWATVPGSGGTAQFRYEVDSRTFDTDGRLRLRSTGRVGRETRTVVADLKQQGFIDFLYFTDYEMQDPLFSGASTSTCLKYAWQGRPTTGCSEIAFGSNDEINGPAHSNDTMRICEATFNGAVTTGFVPASPTALRYNPRTSANASCGGQNFLPGYPSSSGVIPMPPTNSQLRKEVRTDQPYDVPVPGCLYTGPTTIDFTSNGKMRVRSPWTIKTQVAGDPATSGTDPAKCGAVGTSPGQLGHANGAEIDVLNNNVVYVQNVPTVSTDPNFRSSTPPGITVTTGANGSNGLGYPTTGEVQPDFATSTRPAYGGRNGDVFVKGTVKGSITIAAENYVYVVGDLKASDREKDLVGLIGNNAVWVWNPMKTSGWSGKAAILTDSSRTIDAAVLSVAHTFQVQNYGSGGDRGELRVYGAISQKFRGIVRSGSHGYSKEYTYNDRFRYTAPPKFLSPVTTTYGVTTWVETRPAFDGNGAYR